MSTMTARRRFALGVVALVVTAVVLALVAAAFAALPVAIALACAVFALVVGLRSHINVASGRWSRRTRARPDRDPWATACLPPALDGPSWTTTWDALPTPHAIPAARKQATTALAEWNVRGETTQPSLLVLTELMTNAIEHGHPPLRITLRLGEDFVRVEVHDTAPEPPRSHPHPDGRGRGLEIVAALALRHGWTPNRHGKIVWADIPHGWPD
jgi:Histidine kinase-like ATPase domain